MTVKVSILAPAKINLRLIVLAREESGFHQLETLFCGIGLADHLEVEEMPGNGVELRVDGEVDTGPPEQNLVVRAARAFMQAAGMAVGLRIRLGKSIPSAAGLGGGSSDAAAMLRALNAMFDDPISNEAVLMLASRLGSDVPFFLAPTPYAVAWGRGDRLLAMQPLPPRAVLIGHPGVSMPTPAAFRRFAELRKSGEPAPATALNDDQLKSWEGVARLARNDLEIPAHEAIEGLQIATELLKNSGATIALLAGSGSAIFGIFESDEACSAAEIGLRERGMRTWKTSTLQHWPAPVAE